MLDKAIQWFYDQKARGITYSMVYRTGPNSYDCSSAVYYALKGAGLLPGNIGIGNTDSMFSNLENNGWQQVPTDVNGNAAVRRGDVFIWGKRGASGGAAGHTGMFIDENNIIHCSYGYNGIHVDNHDWLWGYNGSPPYTFYRYVGGSSPAPAPTPAPGATYVKFDRIYKADDDAYVNNMWQVYTQALAPKGFTWDDNGIPAAPLVQVDSDGYRTPDQDFKTHKTYRLPGKFRVEDQVWDEGVLWYLVTIGGYGVWVDSAAVANIGANDAGTAQPVTRPVATQPPQTPAPTKPPATQPPQTTPPATAPPQTQPPVTNPPQTQPPETQAPIETKPPKGDKEMAFNKEDIEELKIATQKVQTVANTVAEAEDVKEITRRFSPRTRMTVYIIGDSLIVAGVLVPSLAVALALDLSLVQIAAWSSLLGSSGGLLLTMFGIAKDK